MQGNPDDLFKNLLPPVAYSDYSSGEGRPTGGPSLEEQKLLLESLQLASSSTEYETSQKRRELVDSLNFLSQDPARPVVKVSVSPPDDDRLWKRKYRSSANSLEVTPDMKKSFSQGPFSRMEREKVQIAVDEYRALKGIPESDLHYLVHRRTKSIPKVVQTLGASAAGDSALNSNPYSAPEYKGFVKWVLETSKINRSLDQLYWFMSRAYCMVRTEGRRWTQEEDDKLKYLVALKGHKWKEIEREMGMTDVMCRWKKIQRAEKGFKTGRWDDDEERRLLDGMAELMIKYHMTDVSTFSQWSEVAERVGTRSDGQCRNKYVHDLSRRSDLFNPTNKSAPARVRWSTEDDRILLSRMLAMCASKARDESEIIWDNLSTPSWHHWAGSMLRRRWTRMRSRVPGNENMSLSDVVQYCFQYLHSISSSKAKRRDLLINDEDEELDHSDDETTMQNGGMITWTLEDSQELLSRIATLSPDAEDEEDVEWEHIVWVPWDALTLRKQFAELATRVPGAHNLTFLQLVQYAQNHLKELTAIASPELVSQSLPMMAQVMAAEEQAIHNVFVSVDPNGQVIAHHEETEEEESEQDSAPTRSSIRSPEKRKASPTRASPKKKAKKAKKAKK